MSLYFVSFSLCCELLEHVLLHLLVIVDSFLNVKLVVVGVLRVLPACLHTVVDYILRVLGVSAERAEVVM